MDETRWRRVEGLYHAALEFAPAQREAFLATACADDLELRREIESLLSHNDSRQKLFAKPAWADESGLTDATDSTDEPLEKVPDKIGAYWIRNRLGEGGMGTVYLAEQSEPFRREVALKVIRPGMGSKSVVTRFKSERRTLALMDHPYIAQVYDAGTSNQGVPYFAMELVDGVSSRSTANRSNWPFTNGLGFS
jgi:hypothetical protein